MSEDTFLKNFSGEPQTEYIIMNDIPAENIKMRIDFPNKITPFRPDYNFSLPLSWTLEQFKRDLKKSKYSPNNSILKEY